VSSILSSSTSTTILDLATAIIELPTDRLQEQYRGSERTRAAPMPFPACQPDGERQEWRPANFGAITPSVVVFFLDAIPLVLNLSV
jgi:hypothetical protein